MSRSATFHNDQSTSSRGSQEGSDAVGDDKDEEIARLKRVYHDAIMENSNKKASAKTNT